MSQRCSFCKEKAVYIKENKKRYCKEHFNKYYLKRVEGYLYKHHIYNKKILIAVSGGKDSAALSHSLNKLKDKWKLTLTLFYINLGIINDYSNKGLKTVNELAKKLGLNKIIINLKEYKTIPELKEQEKNIPICSLCGTMKRYLINKTAYEEGYDYVAVGHNKTDEAAFLLHNLMNKNTELIIRESEILPAEPEKKLAGKIKPLHKLSEKENAIYTIINQVPFYNDECPYAENNPQSKNKEKLLEIEKIIPRFSDKLMKGIKELKEKRTTTKEETIKKCKKCGYPTTKEECRFCRLTTKNKEEKEE